MNNAPIGILDSGSGGLSIMRSLHAMLPVESLLYIGDHAHNPYGGKSSAYIRKRTLLLMKFLLAKRCKLIVIACNTATIAGIEVYRKMYPDIPIVGVVPVVKTAANRSILRHALVLSTNFTAQSQYQKDLIKKFSGGCRITSVGSSTLVPLIESGHTDGTEIDTELRALFHYVKNKPFDVVALGCTHYPFIRESIQKIVGNRVEILDSSDAVARQVTRILTHRSALADERGQDAFFTTGDEETVGKTYKKLLDRAVPVTHVEV